MITVANSKAAAIKTAIRIKTNELARKAIRKKVLFFWFNKRGKKEKKKKKGFLLTESQVREISGSKGQKKKKKMVQKFKMMRLSV